MVRVLKTDKDSSTLVLFFTCSLKGAHPAGVYIQPVFHVIDCLC